MCSRQLEWLELPHWFVWPSRSPTSAYGVKLIVVCISCYYLMTNLLMLPPPERKMYPGDWHDLCECVNLASTRWINAIIGQTWRRENPFKARKAKQGPWLIHLANLRVMYECQGTLVSRQTWVCVGCSPCFVFLVPVKMHFACRAVCSRPCLPPVLSSCTVPVNKTNGA